MDRNETPCKHWDRDQVERDTDGVPAGEQGEVWNRHQMETDDTGVDRLDSTPTLSGEVEDPAAGGLSGHGQPAGESHFERNDPTE